LPDPKLEQPIENFYREILTPAVGGLVEYWRDASLGAIDITGSKLFGWVELDIERKNAGIGSGVGRKKLADLAVSAALRDHLDPINGFFNQVAIITQNWTTDSVPGGTVGSPDWTNPSDPRAPFWIDGSQDRDSGKITLTPPHDGNISAHEMGHTLGMQHDVGSDFVTHYADPCCIMSQNGSFPHPRWHVNFGPALCLPHLLQQDWMYQRRVYFDDGGWQRQPNGIVLPLATLTDPGALANLGIKLHWNSPDDNWDYYLEYVRPIGWNQGIGTAFLMIRRLAVVAVGETPIYLGAVPVPTSRGIRTDFVEPMGNVRFQIEWSDDSGRILKVGAKRL